MGQWVSLLASGRRDGRCGASDAESGNTQLPSAVSPDGTRVLFAEGAAATAVDVMMLTLDKDHRVQPLVQTPFAELNGRSHPTAVAGVPVQRLGAVSDFRAAVSGREQRAWQVSTGGGTQPLWARNGQELFYLAPDGALMSVPVERGTTWTAGTPTKLIDGRTPGGASPPRPLRCVAWTASGF